MCTIKIVRINFFYPQTRILSTNTLGEEGGNKLWQQKQRQHLFISEIEPHTSFASSSLNTTHVCGCGAVEVYFKENTSLFMWTASKMLNMSRIF